MPANLGIPCRHFFRIWIDVQNLPFHISQGGYKTQILLLNLLPLCPEVQLPTRTLRSAFASNPLDKASHETTPPPRTQTIPARDVLHNVQAAIRPLIAGIQTREQVSELIHSLRDLHQRNINETHSERITDPSLTKVDHTLVALRGL
ncbi:hypothetical protein B0H13DRAFT_2571422 [Mycena leptocephala]|nr:hypothetical protein B0H13DRAFT_2571422 [Mycena leptocephala]